MNMPKKPEYNYMQRQHAGSRPLLAAYFQSDARHFSLAGGYAFSLFVQQSPLMAKFSFPFIRYFEPDQSCFNESR
jgi:hypothetical protein